MHDIDSTRLETSPDYNEYLEYQELNGEGEDSFEMLMTEEEEEALAAELLGVSSEEELDQFLGGLFRKIKRGLGGAAKFVSQNAGPLSAALKGIAARALPHLGGLLGTAIPIPGVGTALGSALGGAASRLLQSELDHLETEQQDYEMSKRFVRLASQAFRQAGRIRRRTTPAATVNFAMRNALQRLRGRGGFWPQPIYRRCPPCPACPTCAQALPAGDLTSPADGGDLGTSDGAAPGGNVDAGAEPSGEFAFEGEGEFGFAGEGEGEGEGESYETDNEFFASSSAGSGRSGRWVRRGRKIVLYGL
jgi:hypothetical protein